MMNLLDTSLLAVLVLLPALQEAQQPAGPENQQVIDVLRNDRLLVQLCVPPHVSRIDEQWLTITLTNMGENSLEIADGSFGFNAVVLVPDPQAVIMTTNLGSAHFQALFPDRWGPFADRVKLTLGPGETIRSGPFVWEHARGRLLNEPLHADRLIEAVLHFSVQLAGEAPVQVAAPFAFTWEAVSSTELAQLQGELRDRLAKPEASPPRTITYVLDALLKHSELTDGLTVRDFLSALSAREGNHYERDYIVREIVNRYPGAPEVVAYYIEKLSEGNVWAQRDLSTSDRWTGIWHDDFVEPLVRMVEGPVWGDAWHVLDAHSDSWRHDAGIVRRLGTRVSAGLDRAKLAADLAREPKAWALTIEMLAMTRDSSLVPLIAPGLDVTIRIVEDTPLRDASLWRSPLSRPARVCDVALDAILKIQYGRAEDGYSYGKLMRAHLHQNDVEREQAIMRLRDEMIEQLKRDLEAERVDVPPIGDR